MALALASIAYFASAIAFYPVSAIVLVAGLILSSSFWALSSPVRTSQSSTKATMSLNRDEVTRMYLRVEAAAAGFTSSRMGVAAILRQRLVNRHYGVATPPPAWDTSKEGGSSSGLIDMLRGKADLLDVFEPAEREEPRSRFLRRSRIDAGYVGKLERALSFLEDGEI